MTYNLQGVISLASNTPGMPTGYGVQGRLLIDKMTQAGLSVAALSNYGLEGAMSSIKTKHAIVPHYPRGQTLYSGDVIKPFHEHHLAGRDISNFVLTLYDVWVYLGLPLDDIEIVSWTPLDHETMPTKVEAWSRQKNVTPLAMSPFGQRSFEAKGIESFYIPHAYNSHYKPTKLIEKTPHREYMGLKDSDFLVGMVSANKANGQIHRKAYAENLLAFAMFRAKHPDSYLYIHADPTKMFGGFDLINLIKRMGIPEQSVLFPDREKMRFGYSDQEMAALYTSMDVLLHVSYGEGFGVPAIEAQACGTRVIGSSWAATPDLLSDDSWLVEGQPFWDEPLNAFFRIPLIPSILNALEESYKADRGESQASIQFAKQFHIDKVWDNYWLPFLKEKLK